MDEREHHAEVTPEEIARISASGTRVTLPKGWAPISEKTGADKAYVILNGTVSVRSRGAEVAQLGPGEIVGEAAILNHSLRTATIVALNGDADIDVDRHPTVRAARAQLDRARLDLSYATVTAPDDGIVTKVDDLQIGDSTVRFLNAVSDLVLLRDRLVDVGSDRVDESVAITA